MWLVSNMENHKLDPEVSKEEFKKFANSTGLLICIEDIKNFKKLSQILAWQYDDNMTYRNKEVRCRLLMWHTGLGVSQGRVETAHKREAR